MYFFQLILNADWLLIDVLCVGSDVATHLRDLLFLAIQVIHELGDLKCR